MTKTQIVAKVAETAGITKKQAVEALGVVVDSNHSPVYRVQLE